MFTAHLQGDWKQQQRELQKSLKRCDRHIYAADGCHSGACQQSTGRYVQKNLRILIIGPVNKFSVPAMLGQELTCFT